MLVCGEVQRSVKHSTMPVHIVDCTQDLTVISSDNVCFRCYVLGLCSLYRRVDHSSSRCARLAAILEPVENLSGECSSDI